MGWDRGYYYRVKKVNGRVVREYIGKGRVAELVAQLDELEREKRFAEADAVRAEKADLEALEGELDVLTERADLAARAALLTAGYHQHHRGDWRKKRGEKDDAGNDSSAETAGHSRPGGPCPGGGQDGPA